MDLSKFKTDNQKDVSGDDNDVIGGSRIFDTDIYAFTIEAAYLSESKNGATGVNLRLKAEDGRDLRFEGAMGAVYITNRKGEPFYLDKQTKEKKFLPGFLQIQSLCLLAAGMELGDMEPEDKVIGVYSPDNKKEMPTTVPMLMDLVGTTFYGAIERQLHDKTDKDNNGEYQPTGETFEKNELVKVFRERDQLTKSEIEAEVEIAEEDTFFARWKEKNKGNVRDKSKGVSGSAPKQGTPPTSSGSNPEAASATKKKLFN